MDAELLQRIMDLAEKTGDRVIVVNPKSGAAHAVVPFDAYERMATGSASLRGLEGDFAPHDEDETIHVMGEESGIKETLVSRLEEIERQAIKNDFEDNIVKVSQKEAGGLTSLDVLDEGADEEQYYLEPLE